jgi:hypothetical protein
MSNYPLRLLGGIPSRMIGVVCAAMLMAGTIVLVPASPVAAILPSTFFVGTPGTGAPPATLGTFSMTPFGTDSQAAGCTSSVSGPRGTVGFSQALKHDKVGVSWATWSNGYTGDVYANDGNCSAVGSVTINLPALTYAFYFYAEPVLFGNHTITATTNDGTTSGAVTVNGNGGAKYFGFYSPGFAITSITISSPDPGGFAIGEFGIEKGPALSKEFGVNFMQIGDVTSLTFTLTNPNTSLTLNGVTIQDDFPAGVVVAPTPGVVNGCGGSPSGTTGGSVGVDLTGVTLTPGASCTFAVNVTANSAGSKTNTTHQVTSSNGGSGNFASQILNVIILHPTIQKFFNPSTIPLHGTTSLDFTIRNENRSSLATLTGVGFTDTLPAGLSFSLPIVGNCDGTALTGTASSISLSGATVPGDSHCSFSETVVGDTAGVKTNTTSDVSSNEAGSGPPATAQLTVLPCVAGLTAYQLAATSNTASFTGLFCINPATGQGTYQQYGSPAASGSGSVTISGGITRISAYGSNLALVGTINGTVSSFRETAPLRSAGTFTLT